MTHTRSPVLQGPDAHAPLPRPPDALIQRQQLVARNRLDRVLTRPVLRHVCKVGEVVLAHKQLRRGGHGVQVQPLGAAGVVAEARQEGVGNGM